MTGEVADRLDGMALFWKKATEYFTKFIYLFIQFLTYNIERLFNPKFYWLLVLRLVHTIRFSDPTIFLALFQLMEMLISISNFLESE